MTSSVYLSRDEEHMLARLATVNGLKPNMVLRLGLHELAGRADRTGRLPLVGRTPAGSTGPPARAPSSSPDLS